MAGDWLKIDLELPDKPEVYRIAGVLNIDHDAVVGKLIRVWQWFDKHTTNGNAVGVTFMLADRITGVKGFGDAMSLAGWLEQDGDTLIMPGFDKHTSESAKKRALTAKRVAKHKEKSNAIANDACVSDALPREEKRREEIHIAEKPKSSMAKKSTLPENFGISERVKFWAEENRHTRLAERLEYFIGYARSSGNTYADWDQAFMNSIRDDWAKLGRTQSDTGMTKEEKTKAWMMKMHGISS